jgi:hypothetical protein
MLMSDTILAFCGSHPPEQRRHVPPSGYRVLHGRHSSVLHVGQDVGVGVNRLGDRGVPEHLLHNFGMRPLGEQERGEGVAEVVEPYRG